MSGYLGEVDGNWSIRTAGAPPPRSHDVTDAPDSTCAADRFIDVVATADKTIRAAQALLGAVLVMVYLAHDVVTAVASVVDDDRSTLSLS
jgi:hypothetical protein